MAEEGAKRSCQGNDGISNHTATTSSVQDLEEDMLIEILSRLPTAASAIRLKLICKSWCSLISTPYFIKTFIGIHSRYHDSDKYSDDDDNKYQKPFGFLFTYAPPFGERHPKCSVAKFSRNSCFDFQDFSPSRNHPEKKQDVIVLASFNDLILCVSGMPRTSTSYFLCNPFTKQWVALPSPSPVTTHPFSKFGLVCEPYSCGENVINSLYRYRIVRFSHGCHFSASGNLFAVETYYSETGQWVESGSLGVVKYNNMGSNIVAFNGKLWWIDAGRRFLVSYDPFNMGHRRRISLMDDANLFQPSDREVYKLRIGVSEGVLRVVRFGKFNEHPHCSVWDLEKKVMVGGECRFRLKHEGKDMDRFCKEVGATTHKDVVYFYSRRGGTFTKYNMLSREFKPFSFRQLCEDDHCKIFPVELPWWPTPLLDRSSITLVGSAHVPEQ